MAYTRACMWRALMNNNSVEELTDVWRQSEPNTDPSVDADPNVQIIGYKTYTTFT